MSHQIYHKQYRIYKHKAQGLSDCKSDIAPVEEVHFGFLMRVWSLCTMLKIRPVAIAGEWPLEALMAMGELISAQSPYVLGSQH